MKVVIGGASGFIGKNLVRLLNKEGHDVVTLSRTAGNGMMTWRDLEHGGLPNGTQAVINLAGQNIMSPKRWSEDFQREVQSSRIDTTHQLATAIQQASPSPAIWISSSAIGYYPPSATSQYTEDAPGGSDFFGTLCRDWENAASLSPDCETRHTTLRLGIVLGSGGGLIQRVYLPFFFGLGGRIGSGNQWFPWIHLADVLGIIKYVLENDHVFGVLNAVAPQAATNVDFTREFAAAMHRPAMFPVPALLLSMMLGAERANAITAGQRVIPKRTQEAGYKFIYPELKAACKDCSKWRPQ